MANEKEGSKDPAIQLVEENKAKAEKTLHDAMLKESQELKTKTTIPPSGSNINPFEF